MADTSTNLPSSPSKGASPRPSRKSDPTPPPPPRHKKTPQPPPQPAPYATQDPNKIVLKAVYLFSAASQNRPIASLVSGINGVTDGLVLRITTEGLFIDDDVASFSHREWDVKAWTIRLVEIFCPRYTPPPRPASDSKSNPMRKMFGQEKPQQRTEEEMDAIIESFGRVCRTQCAVTGKTSGQHMLRASVRDAEGRRYIFITEEEEAWKLGGSVQRIRKGSQARQLVVEGMGTAEASLIMTKLRSV
jgi:hypothetical protein